MNTKKSKRIFIGILSIVLIMALSLAGMLLISGAEYTYHDMDAYDWQDVLDALATNPADYDHDGVNIILQNNVSSTETLAIPVGARIKLSGDYSLVTQGAHAAISVNGIFTLDGPTITRSGVSNQSLTRGVIVFADGHFIMESGQISGHGINNVQGAVYNPALGTTVLTSGGAGVSVVGVNAMFTMNGGAITGNASAHTAAGVNVAANESGNNYPENAIFIMNGGYITANNGTSQGGGVHLSNGTLIMNGGEISYNTLSPTDGGGLGGGVSMGWGNNTFTMNDGRIANNTAAQGAGVNVNGWHSENTFIINGGEIVGNRATRHGGAITISAEASVTMNGGLIHDNRVTTGGDNFVNAAVSLGDGEFIMNGGVISGNAIAVNVARSWSDYGSTFTMNGGEITDNTTGVRVYRSTIVMNDGEISDNTRGVSLSRSNFTMHDGSISNNNGQHAAGVDVSLASNFTMNGGQINGNTTTASGAGVTIGGNELSTFTMNGGEIRGNHAGTHGAGVRIGHSGAFVMNDGLITANTAVRSGAGMEILGDGTFVMNGGVVSYNVASGEIYNDYDELVPSGWGAGIFIAGSDSENSKVTINNGQIINNTARVSGGAMLIARSNVTINNVTMTGNIAELLDGGAIWIHYDENPWGTVPSKLTINGGSITNNTAGRDGGAIFVAQHPEDYRVPMVSTDYHNLTIAASVIFSGNIARFAVLPHSTATAITRIASTNTSIFGHLLNNFDINFVPTDEVFLVTFLAGAHGTFANYVTYIAIQVPAGTVLTAAYVPNILENADWTHIGWATNPMTNPVGFVVNADVTFIAQYEANGSPQTGIYGFVIGAIALVTLGGTMFVFVKKADKVNI